MLWHTTKSVVLEIDAPHILNVLRDACVRQRALEVARRIALLPTIACCRRVDVEHSPTSRRNRIREATSSDCIWQVLAGKARAAVSIQLDAPRRRVKLGKRRVLVAAGGPAVQEQEKELPTPKALGKCHHR